VFLPSNGAISWQSPRQSLIAMSTLKAKFIAYSEVSRERSAQMPNSQPFLQTHGCKWGRYTHESNGFEVIGGQLEVNWRSI
jgi:hypothetical protein